VLLNFIVAIMMGAFSEENAKLKPKSVAVLLTETVDRQRNTMVARIKKAMHVACSSKQMPEDTLLEKLNEFLEDFTKEAVAADDEFEIEDFEFGRYDLFKIIARAELEDIGDEYLDGMWFAIVDDFNNTQEDDADVEKEAISQHVYEFVKESIGEYFNDFRLKMFGDNNFLAQLDNRRKYLDDETREDAGHQYNAVSQVKSVPIRMKNGKVPADTLSYLSELASRSQAVERTVHLSRDLVLDATDECPAPIRRDQIPHALPPNVPFFSAQPILDAHGELPDPEDAKRKALRNARQNKKKTNNTGGAASDAASPNAMSMMGASTMGVSMMGASVLGGPQEELENEGSISDLPPQPLAFPSADTIDERIITEFNGHTLPSGAEWLATESEAYVWSRTRQCFLHMPSGHFCSVDGTQWFCPESGKQSWTSAIERRNFLDKQRIDAAAEQDKAAAARVGRECKATVSLSAAEARLEAERTAATRWVDNVDAVPLPRQQHVKGGADPSWKPVPAFAYSPPPVGKWTPMPDAEGFFKDAEHGLLFFAHAGHYYDPVTRLWFVPTLGKWLDNVEHEQTLNQLSMAGKY
jgi:hypothetical protein